MYMSVCVRACVFVCFPIIRIIRFVIIITFIVLVILRVCYAQFIHNLQIYQHTRAQLALERHHKTQPQRPEVPIVTHACKCEVHLQIYRHCHYPSSDNSEDIGCHYWYATEVLFPYISG